MISIAISSVAGERRELCPEICCEPASEPLGTQVQVGDRIGLTDHWAEIAKAPRDELVTLELWIRPDEAAIGRSRSFILILSSANGADALGLSLFLKDGAVCGNVFGRFFEAPEKLAADQWAHVALTVNSQTVNKQAKLWVNGQIVAEDLILNEWPKDFEVAEMLSDHWNQGRAFSGKLGDVRISKVLRYDEKFSPANHLPKDENTVLLIEAGSF